MKFRKTKPLTLSIIIPAYNEEHQIKLCLNAIAEQTETPDEVIVVDNNCTDKTIEIAETYPFVTVLREKKQGIAYARNKGFDASSSDIIGRIDVDTTLPADWVKRVKEFYADPENADCALTGGCYFSNLTFPPAGVNGAIHSAIAFRFNRMILGHHILWGSNMAILQTQWKAVRKKVCNDTDIHEDLDLAIHLKDQNIKIVYDPSLKVGVVMKRVMDDWKSLYPNLMWWPRTLKRHNNKRWVFGLAGAYLLLVSSFLVVIFNKPFAGRKKTQ